MSKMVHKHATLSLSPAKAATSKVAFTWYRQQSCCSVSPVTQDTHANYECLIFVKSHLFNPRSCTGWSFNSKVSFQKSTRTVQTKQSAIWLYIRFILMLSSKRKISKSGKPFKSLKELGNELKRFYYREHVSLVLGLSLNRYYADGTLSWVSHKNITIRYCFVC